MTTQAHELDVADVSKAFVGTRALLPTTFAVRKGEFVTILGPSGCGKSTLLRIITGITEPSGGRILLRGQDITRLPPERRDIAIVFQSYALFPHMSVGDNIQFGLKMKRVPKEERKRRFSEVVAICGLEKLVSRSPRELSGGQQQRVALARALVVQPALLLLDEPLSNLDAKLRETLREELMALHRRTGSTTLYVTHDQSEAMSMSDRIIVMKDGQVVESGAPRSLYMSPRLRFTALFFGHTNIVPVDVDGGLARLPWGGAVSLTEKASGRGEISLRPECLMLADDPTGPGVIASATFMGADVYYTVRIGDRLLRARHASMTPFAEGTRVSVTVDSAVSLLAADPAASANTAVEAQ